MARYDEYDDDRDDDRPRARRDDDHSYGKYDDEYDDYDNDRPQRPSRKLAREKVALPAIFLMVVGAIGILFAIVRTIIDLTIGADQAGQNPFGPPNNDPGLKKIQQIANIVGPFLNLAWGLIVLFGGIQMKKLKSRGFVMFSCVWAMLPCTLCCMIGIPFGIWGLVAINDESVKRYF
jgi:hypothetical protein